MRSADFGFRGFPADSTGRSGLIQREICESVCIAIQFSPDVLDDEVLNLTSQFRGAFVQRLQVRAFHFVAALHLPDEKLGIAPNSKRGNVVSCRVVQRSQKRVVLGDVICFTADMFRQLQDDFPGSIPQNYSVRRRAGIAARSSVYVSDVNSRRRAGQMSVGE